MENSQYAESINNIIEFYDNEPSNLLQILLKVQDKTPAKFISKEVGNYIANKLNIPSSKVSEVISYFDAINTSPKGKYIIGVCNSTACFANGYEKIGKVFEEELGIKMGQTTEDGMFSLKYTPCFGACDVSPAVRINNSVVGNLTPAKVKQLLKNLKGGSSNE